MIYIQYTNSDFYEDLYFFVNIDKIVVKKNDLNKILLKKIYIKNKNEIIDIIEKDLHFQDKCTNLMLNNIENNIYNLIDDYGTEWYKFRDESIEVKHIKMLNLLKKKFDCLVLLSK